jgi:hypothetical protein
MGHSDKLATAVHRKLSFTLTTQFLPLRRTCLHDYFLLYCLSSCDNYCPNSLVCKSHTQCSPRMPMPTMRNISFRKMGKVTMLNKVRGCVRITVQTRKTACAATVDGLISGISSTMQSGKRYILGIWATARSGNALSVSSL